MEKDFLTEHIFTDPSGEKSTAVGRVRLFVITLALKSLAFEPTTPRLDFSYTCGSWPYLVGN